MSEGALPGGWCSEESIWQLVECCGYVADLAVWTRLAEGAGSVLDLGCGIGRVAHHLGEAGHAVTGVDDDPGMVADFNRRSPDASVVAELGDALAPRADRADLILAPQQLVQIVGGRHRELIDSAAGSLDPGGRLAVAITEDLPTRDLAPDLVPDVREIEEWVFTSRPALLEAGPDEVAVTRVRHRVSPEGELTETTDRISFRRLDRDGLAADFERAGFSGIELFEIPATDAHMASVVISGVR